jgi:sulfate-transporting ATPase
MFGLMALGIVAVQRASGVINFAIGAVGLTGAYVQWRLHDVAGWSSWLSIPAGIAFSALLSAVTYYGVVRRLRDSSNLARVVATLAVLIIIQAALTIAYPATLSNLAVEGVLPTKSVTVLGLTVGGDRLLLLLIGGILTAAAWAFFRFTRFGLATTAVSDYPLGVASLGWNEDRVAGINFAIAGAMAGLAMILIVPITGISVGSATFFLLPALAAAVIGSLTSFPGAFLGGLLIAVLQIEASQYLTSVQGASDAIPFLLIIAMLTIRGRRIPLRSFTNERLPRVGTGRIRWIPLIIVFAIATAILLSGWLSPVWLGAATITLVTAVVLASFVVIIGYAGQVSLAQWVIAGIGAVIAAHLTEWGVPFLLAVVITLLAMVPIGLLLAIPATRVRGMSLAIVTLGFAVAGSSLILGSSTFVGTPGLGLRLPSPSVFGLSVDPILHPSRYAVFVLVVLTIVLIVVANVRRGNAGRRLLALRANERAAAALGIDATEAKTVAFIFAAGIAALGGIVTIYQLSVATFSAFDPFTSIQFVGWSVLSGVGYVVGPVVGGLFPTGSLGGQAFETLFPGHGNYVALIGGVLLLITILTQPDGVVRGNIDMAQSIWRKIRPSPATKEAKEPRVKVVADPVSETGMTDRNRAAPPRLEVRNLTVEFSGVRAVDDVTLTLSGGEVLGVIGPNGAGKTTLIDAITGFVTTTGGEILLGGRPLDKVTAAHRARQGIARSFQSLELFEDLTVVENLIVASDRHRRVDWITSAVRPDTGHLTRVTMDMVEELGLEPFLAELPPSLPHGRRRLVSIARAFASSPSILLLDEPAAGLDEVDRRHLVAIIRELAVDHGIGVLLIEHDVQLVKASADRMICLDVGRCIASGAPDEVLRDPAVIGAYVGTDEAHQPMGEIAEPLPEQAGA